MSSNASVKPILWTDFMFFNQIFFNLPCLSEHIVHLNISFLSQLRICVFTCITGYSVHEIMTSKQFSLNNRRHYNDTLNNSIGVSWSKYEGCLSNIKTSTKVIHDNVSQCFDQVLNIKAYFAFMGHKNVLIILKSWQVLTTTKIYNKKHDLKRISKKCT